MTTNNNAPCPAVSVIIPCRNEKPYIESCLRSILRQADPPGGFEVIVVDGMSEDGTRGIVEGLAEKEKRLRLVENACRITPCGMNAGIRHARGRYIAIIGAHSEYAPDYIRQCLAILERHPEVCCSGGPVVSRGRSVFGRAVARAMSHPLGVGNARHRFPDYEGYAEGACFPMFRREVFNEIGLYDENLPRNQDDELNYRIARRGGKVFISPRAQCTYHVRETLSGVFRQYLQYGYWRVAVLRKHRLPASARHFVPVVFFFLVFFLLVTGLGLSGWWNLAAAALPAFYACTLLAAGARVAVKRRDPGAGLMFPIAACVMHAAYAIGFVWGLMSQTTNPVPRHYCCQGGPPVHSESHAAKFFDGFADAFDTLYDGRRNLLMRWVDRCFRSDMFIRFTLTFRAFGDLSGKTVLDIGCGSGPYVVEALNRRATWVTALDPAPHMLALAREKIARRGGGRCSFVEGFFPGIELEPHDHVIVMGVMDYVADAGSFLTALRPLVNLSAAISFPSRHWLRTPLRRFRYWLRGCPVHFYDSGNIRGLCLAAGFGQIEIRKIAGAGMDYHVCLRP